MANKYKVSRGMSAAINRGFSHAKIASSNENALSKITCLQLLSTSNVCDISIMSQMTNLKTADLSSNNITDLTPLKNLTTLERLYINDNYGVEDISPLSNLQNLHTLSITNLTKIKNLSVLTKLEGLKSLYCRRTNIDPDILSKIPNLHDVNNMDNTIKDNRYWYSLYGFTKTYRYGLNTHPENAVLHKAENVWYLTFDDYIWVIVGCLDNRKYVLDFLTYIFRKYSTDDLIKIIKRKPYVILDGDVQNQLDIMEGGIDDKHISG